MDKKPVVIDVAGFNCSNIRKKEPFRNWRHQSLREQLERTWGVETTLVSGVSGELGTLTPKVRSG